MRGEISDRFLCGARRVARIGMAVAAVVAHGCTKEARVDPSDIRRASLRRELFLNDPANHTYDD
jgi:hypothetical protein